MPVLPDAPTLADFQQYVLELEKERGFSDQTLLEKCLLLGEEVGELFRAVRRTEGLPTAASSPAAEAAEELADVLIYLCTIANRLGIDLEEAFRHKERANAGRSWS